MIAKRLRSGLIGDHRSSGIMSGVSTQQFDSFVSAMCRRTAMLNFNSLNASKWHQVDVTSQKAKD